MPLTADGNYIDAEHAFKCECGYWYCEEEGTYVPELPGTLCEDCLEHYKDELTPSQLKGSSLDNTDYDSMGKDL